jgi:hypothetical protein
VSKSKLALVSADFRFAVAKLDMANRVSTERTNFNSLVCVTTERDKLRWSPKIGLVIAKMAMDDVGLTPDKSTFEADVLIK